MAEGPTSAVGGEALPFLEKLASGRFLVLLVAFLLYFDMWVIPTGVDPTKITFASATDLASNVSLYAVAAFVLTFSFLMGRVFPVLRALVAHGWLRVVGSVTLSRHRTESGSKLADWSLAVVVLSVCDLLLAALNSGAYPGVTGKILGFFAGGSLEQLVLALLAAAFWIACLPRLIHFDEVDE